MLMLPLFKKGFETHSMWLHLEYHLKLFYTTVYFFYFF